MRTDEKTSNQALYAAVMCGCLFQGILVFVFISPHTSNFDSSVFFEKAEILAIAIPFVSIPALKVTSSASIEKWANQESCYKLLRLFCYGFISSFQVYAGLLIAFWACIVVSVLLPYKLISVFILSAEATLKTALVSIVVIWLCSGFSSAILYFCILLKKLGNIRSGHELFYDSTIKGNPWISRAAMQIIYFSFCNMFSVDSGLRGSGSCKWIALFQSSYARLLEIGIIAAGISQIMARHI
jgi:hypothetical protein